MISPMEQLRQAAEATEALRMVVGEARGTMKDLHHEIRDAKKTAPEIVEAAQDEAARMIADDIREYAHARVDAVVDEIAQELRQRLGFPE